DDSVPGERVEPDDLKVMVARNLDKERIVLPKLSSTILEKVVNDGRSMIVADAQHCGELSEARSICDLSIQSILAVPLRVQDEVMGALYLDHRWRQEAFSGATIELCEAFAGQAALALYNARLIGEVEQNARQLEEVNARIKQLNEELEARYEQQTAELTAVRSRLELVGDETQQTAAKFTEIIGNSPALMRVLKMLDKVADSELPVYIHGESGTGKELVARALHRHSRRSEKRFVAVNCAEFTDTLLASELFGHVKGAFTGADKDKKGLFEEADGGTLFLDEIGDMSPGMQTQLLRVLAEGEFRRVGDSQGVRKVSVRIVSASNKDLQDLIEANEFREDLFYRLHNVRIELPPLRDRREDVPLLVSHFLTKICAKPDPPIVPVPDIDKQVIRALINYDWPGNIRELENELQLMVVMREGDHITMEQVSQKLLARPKGPELDELGRTTLKAVVESIEKQYIEKALKKFNFNKSKVAERLGLSRLGLRKKMERYGIASTADGGSDDDDK
ncbi:MAG: sigma 54-interacting transcriptional regulator, partial [Planctomycetota bacterium]